MYAPPTHLTTLSSVVSYTKEGKEVEREDLQVVASVLAAYHDNLGIQGWILEIVYLGLDTRG